ncbi:MAG TPA: FliH/SctL family protein [Clostridia bacterium]|nr:FliH/SctL family protein [Clostridia bacterium]
MSKVYKSEQVSIGTPKPISNAFKSAARPEAVEAPAETGPVETEEAARNIIEDAKEMYLKIIEEANSEARTIVKSAEEEALKLLVEARENGHKEGYEAGYLNGREEARSVIEEASGIREFLDGRKCDIYREAEEQVLQLVLDISKKVIGDEVTQNKEAILSLVNQALQKCAFKKQLVLRVSSQDYEFILEHKERICTLVEGISDIEIVSDLSLSPGSCIVETPSGEINSSIDIQIREIEKIFTYLLGNE